MERMLQYLDDLDDLYGMVGLIVERLRRLIVTALKYILTLAVLPFSVWLAQVHPPIASATLILLFVTLLYRAVTQPAQTWMTSADIADIQ